MTDSATDFIFVTGNYTYSSWSMRGWLAMVHSGHSFETARIELFDDPAEMARLKDLSPSGKVPALVDRRRETPIEVWDSAAIIDYLAVDTPDKYWWPEDRADLALARSIAAEMHSGFMLLRRACPMDIKTGHENLKLSDPLIKEIQRVDTIWQDALARSGGPFLFGDWSAADMMYAPVVTRFITYDLPRTELANSYIRAVMGYDDVARWCALAEEETHIIPIYANVVDGDRLKGDKDI